jgi:ABC-type transport system substrate-binding protein
MDRRALFASGVASALLAATGVSASGAPRKGGRLRMALSGAARSDDWRQGAGLFMQVARQGLVFDTLTELAADGTLRGELATGWQSADNGRRWLFDLREGVRFHDDAPFGAVDVVESLTPLMGGGDLLQAVGPSQVLVELAQADPVLPFRLAGPEYVIHPAHAPNDGIGTGLYRVERFSVGQQILAKRVAEHYKDGTAGWFDEVELVSIPAPDVRAQALGEYLVDAADMSDAKAICDFVDVIALPDVHTIQQGASRELGLPHQISAERPLDNLRAAERWWFA